MYKGLVSDAILWGYGVYCRVTTPIPYLDLQFDTFQCKSREFRKYKDLDVKKVHASSRLWRVMVLFPHFSPFSKEKCAKPLWKSRLNSWGDLLIAQ